jgi:hypothetical protein
VEKQETEKRGNTKENKQKMKRDKKGEDSTIEIRQAKERMKPETVTKKRR